MGQAFPAPTFGHAAEAFVIAHAAPGAWSAGTAVKYRQTLAALGGQLDMACDSRLRALPAAHVDGPAIHYIVTRDQVKPLVVGHGRIDVRRDQPKAVADGPGWREGCVLVRAEPDLRAAKLGVAVIHAECLQAGIGH